ncbi:MAG TPA: 3-isopropylmalate dehydratase small subunit [Candidatus Binatia bacterium]|nr:3-isopropylmalate dehydratase small subunit [Candidatus Binatia bacterium]
MTPFRLLDAAAVPLDEANIDTDQLAPGRFLMRPVFAELLLHDRRFERDGTPRRDFVLNDPAYAGAEIIVSRRNFGVGSSREFAVLALPAAGFRCVIAVSFGDIFYNNCLQNGVLPVVLEEPAVDALLQALRAYPGLHVSVDLPSQTVAASNCGPYPFSINAVRKRCFLEGLDDIALTDRHSEPIAAFEANYYRAFPWLT